MKRRNNNVNSITIISIIIVLLVLCLSVGWASFNSSIRVDSVAMVRIKSDIRITGFNSGTGTNGGTSSKSEYNVKYVNGTVSLPNNNSTMTFEVEITNMELAANTHMGINSLTGLPSNLKIVNISDYTLKSKICDDSDPTDCGTGAQKTFYITIGYKDNAYNASNTTFDFFIDFEFKKVHDITYTGFTTPPISPTTVMDGETPAITFNSDAASTLRVISGGTTLIEGTNYNYSNHILTFITPVRDNIFIVNPSTYTITYVLNGGVQASNQITTYTIDNNEEILSPTKEGNIFGGWYLENDFSGDDIRNTSQITGNVTLYANWVTQIARIGSTYYNTLQDAINAVPTNNVETIVELLANTSEALTVAQNKNIVFDFKNNTLSNKGTANVIVNNGTISISNGKITSSASQGAINNNSTGVMVMSGGRIETTGNRQAIYNDGGTLRISGSAYLSSTSNQRACVQNLNGGTITIAGGTIISTGQNGVENTATLTIGTEGGGVSTTSPTIRGNTYGVKATSNFNFYDGRISGKTLAIDNETHVNDIEDNYVLFHKTETISNASYKSVYLTHEPYIVTLNAMGGTVDPASIQVEPGNAVGTLPTPEKTGFVFDGWYDDPDDGNEVNSNTVVSGSTSFYAHWIDESIYMVARIGNTEYQTIEAALDAVPDNTQTTVTIIKNLTTNITIGSKKNIILDLTGVTLNNDTHYSVITNNGTLTIINGTINSDSVDSAAVNNEKGGTLVINGSTITATGLRQAVYNDKSTATIMGNAHLTSSAPERGTVQNQSKSTMTITGGVIISTTQQAVNNNGGTLTIGTKDGNISVTTPDLRGATYGLTNTSTFNYYDGVIKGITNSINGNITQMETNATRVNTTEVIEGNTYHKTYLD